MELYFKRKMFHNNVLLLGRQKKDRYGVTLVSDDEKAAPSTPCTLHPAPCSDARTIWLRMLPALRIPLCPPSAGAAPPLPPVAPRTPLQPGTDLQTVVAATTFSFSGRTLDWT